MFWTSHPVDKISGIVTAPGDKSCSHRALIFSGLADGTSKISGLLEGEDVLNTGRAMSALGATVDRAGTNQWTVKGVGTAGLVSPSDSLDFGNSGTGSRLIMGVVAGYNISANFTGDASLSSRPMARVITPLKEMGAQFEATDGGRLPLTITGRNPLKPINYCPPQASAQVKSCLLLAGLRAEGTTVITENSTTRDHSERMLRGFGATVSVQSTGEGAIVKIDGGQSLQAQETSVPGDPSSAAFLAAAAIISNQGGVLVENVMSNPTRDGIFRAVALMGAKIGAEEVGLAAGERLINMSFETSPLSGCTVPRNLVPSMIDEFPILAVMAAFADGETIVRDAAELRVKESDRISAVVKMLRVNGVEVEEFEDGFIIQGCGGPVPGGGLVETRHDHRIAMSALIMGTAAQRPVSVDDIAMISTSYPDFFEHMQMLGADMRQTAR